MLDMVENPKDWFSRNTAHLLFVGLSLMRVANSNKISYLLRTGKKIGSCQSSKQEIHGCMCYSTSSYH